MRMVCNSYQAKCVCDRIREVRRRPYLVEKSKCYKWKGAVAIKSKKEIS